MLAQAFKRKLVMSFFIGYFQPNINTLQLEL